MIIIIICISDQSLHKSMTKRKRL